MSAGELIGIIITAVLLGGAITAAVTLTLAIKQGRAGSPRPNQNDANERWLAVRLTLSRVSISFVMAFRSLAKETKESPYYALRTQEAQRARDQWSQAKTEYERALAAVIVQSTNPSIVATLKSMDIVDASELRSAINGSPLTVQKLRDRLDQQDQNAIRWVQQINGPTQSPMELLLKPVRYLQNIIQHWDQ